MWLNMYNYVIIPLVIRNTGPLQCLPILRYNQSTINHQKPTPRDFMVWSLYGQLSWVLKSTEISAALLLTNMLKEVFATCSLSLLLSDSVLLFGFLSLPVYRADTMVVGHIAGEHAEAIFKFMSTRYTPVLQDGISLELSWLNPVYCYRHTKRVSGRNATDNTPTCMKCHWLLC